MLRGNLKLSADMILTKLLKESIAFICQHIIKTNTWADKNFLYLWKSAQFSKKLDIILVVNYKVLHGDGNKHCFPVQTPLVSCFWQAGWRKFAVGPPTSWIYPLKSFSCVISFASRINDSWLLVWMIRPWWNVRAQKLQPPKQPRLLQSENLISEMAGTPPSAS